LALLSSCATLHSVSLTQVPANRSNPVEAEGFSWGILGIYFSNGFVDDAMNDLKSKCPGGRINGVYTKYEGRFYLLWATRTVTAKAFCENGANRT
jgi:hypothetical protein